MLKISLLLRHLQTSRAKHSRGVLFSYEDKQIGRFSNLHLCTFNNCHVICGE